MTGANLVLQLVRRKKEGKKIAPKRLLSIVGTLENDPVEVKPETQGARNA